VSEQDETKIATSKKGISAMFFIMSLLTCLTVGYGGGIYRSCDVSFSGSDDRAICYYRSAINEPFPYADDGEVAKPVVEEVNNAVNLPSKK